MFVTVKDADLFDVFLSFFCILLQALAATTAAKAKKETAGAKKAPAKKAPAAKKVSR